MNNIAPNSIMKYFTYEHLTNEKLKAVSKPFCELAKTIDETIMESNEKQKCLDALLAAKDCAVRACLD